MDTNNIFNDYYKMMIDEIGAYQFWVEQYKGMDDERVYKILAFLLKAKNLMQQYYKGN